MAMKYDFLNQFRQQLLNDGISENTSKTYYKAVKKVLNDQQFNSLSEMDQKLLQKNLLALPSKNQVSAAKNGLKKLQALHPELQIPDDQFFKRLSMTKNNRKKRRFQTLQLDQVKRKINQISNTKLKLAYRLALITGLRISELASLQKQDVFFVSDGRVRVLVKNGKGGKSGEVVSMKDTYVVRRLNEQFSALDHGDEIFYSIDTMKEQAGKLGFQCHDLRRAYAKLLQREKRKEMSFYEANAAVQKALRHERFSTTKRYLSRKINLGESSKQ